MQEIGRVLKRLTLAAETDKDIVAKLTEAVEAMTCNNVSLTTQLRNAMKINLEMAKKLNLKATKNPEYKKMADKANRNDDSYKNLDSGGY